MFSAARTTCEPFSLAIFAPLEKARLLDASELLSQLVDRYQERLAVRFEEQPRAIVVR
jgi:hypothetical protein